MDAASRRMLAGVTVAVPAVACVLVGWAFFAGGASGTDATATLGTAAVLAAAALVVGWAVGSIPLPRLDRAGAVAAGTAIALVGWTGLTIIWSIAGDRSWDTLAKGIAVLGFGVVGLAAAALPGRPLRTL